MSLLKNKIIKLISSNGPINVNEYISIAMYDNKYGYYKNNKILGEKGDFITSPEISQMFGEMIAIWIIETWKNIGKPKELLLCEIGPGYGTLMIDILNTIIKINISLLNYFHIFIIEISENFIKIQKKNLSIFRLPITWIKKIEDLPELPIILYNNELFDALPIHQYIIKNNNFYEKMISVNYNNNLFFLFNKDFNISNSKIEKYYLKNKILFMLKFLQLPLNSILEISPMRDDLIRKISMHICKNRGSSLIIDYGSEKKNFYGDTLQAIYKHTFKNPLDNPGKYDLTSHVDFFSMLYIAKKFQCKAKILNQNNFLRRMGIIERAFILSLNKDKNLKKNIKEDLKRLIDSNQMGNIFKVLCVSDNKTYMIPFE